MKAVYEQIIADLVVDITKLELPSNGDTIFRARFSTLQALHLQEAREGLHSGQETSSN